MKPDTYRLLERCIEDGVKTGLHRAYKHTDEPTYELMADKITQAILHEVCEWFRFDEIQQ